jgi:hypothetical protein
MSLDKAIEHGKEHRRPYYGAKAVDKSCRNHGACVRCAEGRRHKVLKQLPIEDIREIESLVNFKERYRRMCK